MNNLKIKLMAGLGLLLSLSASASSLLLNGDFSDGGIDGGDNSLTVSQIDTGWVAKNGWTISSESAVNKDGWSTGEYGGLSQVISTATKSIIGDQLELTLDYTPPATVTTDVSYQLSYQLIGWNVADGATAASTTLLFVGQNYASTTIGSTDSWGTWDDLLTTTVEDKTSKTTASSGTVTATTAGESMSFTILSVDGLDLSSYDYIGVRLATISQGGEVLTDAGAVVDNVSLMAIPEPATMGLLGLCMISALVISRIFR